MAEKHVAVLMGGLSPERPVSLASGKACAGALEELGYRVSSVDVGRDIALRLAELKPDLAFNALHGPFGEDGTIQGILEYLQIPYTHSGVLASALAMDKAAAKIIAAAAGVHIAPSAVMNRFDLRAGHPLPLPYVVKPVREGSSFGVVIVREGAVPPALLYADDWRYGDEIMAEAYIPGRELTCAVMDGKALDVCEIVPDGGYSFYDYEAKYAPGGSKHVCPAKISSNIYQNIQRMSLAAHCALGCRGISRSDFRYDEQEGLLPVWLELNTQPGMTPTSLVPDIARASGYSFVDVVRFAAEDASCAR
ncbi:D-alanine--D-alanine ligase [Candidatus Tokpelaia sp.]|uniref:D-alanine--D-alanine ligase n=1 Tax=Candidatus Tokpelaia sp. TaxID=2233777 RepID=UPI00123C2416|nr:D-alanine--D-alanine ligase [Candidatus Tokpelaia sp.]KAA6405867.1 D-alanine--D-alanine ligase [Candidatus Tokpelaia sp.]